VKYLTVWLQIVFSCQVCVPYDQGSNIELQISRKELLYHALAASENRNTHSVLRSVHRVDSITDSILCFLPSLSSVCLDQEQSRHFEKTNLRVVGGGKSLKASLEPFQLLSRGCAFLGHRFSRRSFCSLLLPRSAISCRD
jgi:hypothetical protein